MLFSRASHEQTGPATTLRIALFACLGPPPFHPDAVRAGLSRAAAGQADSLSRYKPYCECPPHDPKSVNRGSVLEGEEVWAIMAILRPSDTGLAASAASPAFPHAVFTAWLALLREHSSRVVRFFYEFLLAGDSLFCILRVCSSDVWVAFLETSKRTRESSREAYNSGGSIP